MQFKNFLQESPFIGQSTEFSLVSEKGNKETTDKFISKTPVEVYEEDDRHIFARYGSNEKGQIVWIDKLKLKTRYFVDYKTLNVKGIKKSLTQTKVWRSEHLPRSGMAEHVFYNILFKEFDCITSDSDQTKEGMSFWKRQLTMGHVRGYYVGLYDEDEWTIDWCNPKDDFDDWRKSAYPEAWSSSDQDKQKYRFVISKNKF